MGSNPIIYVIEPFGGSARRHNPALPHLYFDDQAVTRGDGIVETLLVRDGAPANLGRHLRRFARSAGLVGLPDVDTRQWEDVAREAAAEWEGAEGRMTWTYSRGRVSTSLPTAWLVVQALGPGVVEQRERGVKVLTTTRGYTVTETPEWLPAGAKTLSYATTMAAMRYARDKGFDDVVFLDSPGGRVLEGATSTVLVVKKDRKLRTPPAGAEVLAGTTLDAVFDHATACGWRCKERDLSYRDLLDADSVWLVSSTRVAARIRRLDEHKLAPGEQDDEVRALIWEALGA